MTLLRGRRQLDKTQIQTVRGMVVVTNAHLRQNVCTSYLYTAGHCMRNEIL